MAKINTKLSIQAPEEINVPLVRADHLETSNVFRLFFEIFLAISSSLVGVILSTENVEKLLWVFLTVTVLSSIGFLIMSYRYKRPAP
ncbi:hypothetical protein [Pseudoalteromonas ulvae]|uniref:Uncharacterized protein n=1 Tax=Pseudoalteromonas ulvae TaxID=107327 RepID=A0A244CT76_PSEDV|nr:hypothetical protein [Pseudoalteromonas ulvae]OUL58798.1 hypothetical protein B1199_00480 [Pseudoalteromonas ulvae]